MADSQISCVILAAGASRRFGAPKMLTKLADGRLMLEHVIKQYKEVFGQVQVVSRDEYAEKIIAWGGSFIASPNAAQGMSQSLIAGIRANQSSQACMIVLADMPYIETSTIQFLAENGSATRIIIPQHSGQLGNPVVIGQRFFTEVFNLSGDVGAKSICNANPDSVDVVQVADQGVLHDVDTPAAVLR